MTTQPTDHGNDPGFPHTSANAKQPLQPTDDQSLKLFLAGRVEDKLEIYKGDARWIALMGDGKTKCHPISMVHVGDTEWLHVCWLVEQTLNNQQYFDYITKLGFQVDTEYQLNPTGNLRDSHTESASWQSRAKALKRVLEG